MTVSKTTDANRTHGTIVLRGGRLTKWKGKAASLSPSLGQLIASVSPVALGRALMVGASKTATAAVLGGAGLIVTTSGASADNDCSGSGGVFTCSGTIEELQTLSGDPLSVIISEGTTVNVGDQSAFVLKSGTGITFTNDDPEVTIKGERGIFAKNTGTGDLRIKTTGTTTGTDGDGISAENNGTDLTINAATTTGEYYGIVARNNGTGALSITTSGTTTGTNEIGIYAKINNIASTGDLTINAADTTGGQFGIKAVNKGKGALSITTTGTTTGTAKDGIYAKNSGTSLTINAATTTGGKNGIFAQNKGTGALSITTTGETTGGTDYFGINASITNTASTGDLTINAATTTGGYSGIFAQNKGTGALSITTTGTTKGTDYFGIFAYNYNSASTGDLTIVTGEFDAEGDLIKTTGGKDGIRARNYGTGALSIKTTGTTTGTNRDGIFANNSSAGTSLTINAATTTGGANGINAKNSGSGALSITTTGKTTGGTGHGIYAFNAGSGGTSITVASTGSIETSAEGYGIFNKSSGTAAKLNEITVAGSITTAGKGAHGIVQDGGTSIANISGTVSAEGELAAAIFHKSGSGHTVNLAEGAVIEGSISAAKEASNNILVYDEDADYELTIGGEVDVETGTKDEIKGTGAGQWSFYIEDDDGQLSTKDPNGTVIDVVKVANSECVADTNACYTVVYEAPLAPEQLDDITNIDNDALIDSLELGGSGGGSDKSGSSTTTAAQAHHNTVWANVYGIKTTGDETDSRAEMKSRTAGFTIGVPIRTNNDLNWDLVFNMSDSKNKLGSTGDQELNVQSYNLGAVFYNIAPSSGWDVDAFGFIGYNDYDQERDVRDNTEADGIDTRKFSYSGNEILLGFDAEYYKPFNETLDLKFGVNGFLSHQKIDSYSTGEYYKWDTRNMTQGSIGVSTGVEHRKGALMAYADIGVDYVTLLSGKTADYSFNGQARSFTASDTDDVYGKVNVGFEYNQSENVIIDGKLSGFSSTGGISGYAATLGIEVNF